jgi:hypothetical protein
MVGIARRKKETPEQPKYPQSQTTTTLNGNYTLPKSLNGYGGTLGTLSSSGTGTDTLKKNAVYYNNLDYDS